jgi:hypothetical protein
MAVLPNQDGSLLRLALAPRLDKENMPLKVRHGQLGSE